MFYFRIIHQVGRQCDELKTKLLVLTNGHWVWKFDWSAVWCWYTKLQTYVHVHTRGRVASFKYTCMSFYKSKCKRGCPWSEEQRFPFTNPSKNISPCGGQAKGINNLSFCSGNLFANTPPLLTTGLFRTPPGENIATDIHWNPLVHSNNSAWMFSTRSYLAVRVFIDAVVVYAPFVTQRYASLAWTRFGFAHL